MKISWARILIWISNIWNREKEKVSFLFKFLNLLYASCVYWMVYDWFTAVLKLSRKKERKLFSVLKTNWQTKSQAMKLKDCWTRTKCFFVVFLTLRRLGFLKVISGWGGVNMTTPSYFKKNESNIILTIYTC